MSVHNPPALPQKRLEKVFKNLVLAAYI